MSQPDPAARLPQEYKDRIMEAVEVLHSAHLNLLRKPSTETALAFWKAAEKLEVLGNELHNRNLIFDEFAPTLKGK